MPNIDGMRLFEFPASSNDQRGSFSKIYTNDHFDKFNIVEIFLSKTHLGYVRGMHFQSEKFATNRIISCVDGSVHDILIDLRISSNTYLSIFEFELSSKNSVGIFVPRGVAHGFQSLESNSTVLYFTDNVYSAEHDIGVHPLSKSFNWPLEISGISERDLSFPMLEI